MYRLSNAVFTEIVIFNYDRIQAYIKYIPPDYSYVNENVIKFLTGFFIKKILTSLNFGSSMAPH